MAGERTVKIRFVGDSRGVEQAADRGGAAVTKWGGAVEKANGVAAKAAAIGGAAVAAALGAAVATGLEQSQIKAKLAAQLGATGPAAKVAGDAAGDLYARGVVGSMEEAAAAVKTVFQNGLVPKDAGKAEIDAVAARVSSLAVTLDEDASAVGRAVSQMVKTGIADSSEEAFDLLAKGTQLGINKSEDLLDTFNEYGTQFRKLGIDGPQSLGLLNQAIQAGARDSDVAADALKEFTLRAVDVANPETISGFKAIGLNAADMGAAIAAGGDRANVALDKTLDGIRAIKDPVERAKVATQLFGTQAEDLGDALFAMDPSSAAKGIGEIGGAAAQAGKTLEESAGAQVAAFTRQLQEGLVNALASVIGWVQRNEAVVKTLAAVLIPIAGIIGTIVAATKVYTAVQTALNVVMAANPIGLVVLAIAALIAIVVLIATKTKFFQTIWAAVWPKIRAAAEAVGNWFTRTLWPSLKKAFDQLVAVLKFLFSTWKTYFNFILGLGRSLVSGYVSYVTSVVNVLRRIISAVIDVYNAVTSWFGKVIGYVRGLPGKIRSATSGMWNGIKDSFRSAINYVVDRWNSLSFTLPSVNTPFGKIGGTTISTPDLPRLATGGWMQPGRTYLTGENGPELLTSERRAYVNDAGSTAGMLGGGGAPTVQVFIGERELTDIVDVRVTQNNRQLRRAAGARLAGAR